MMEKPDQLEAYNQKVTELQNRTISLQHILHVLVQSEVFIDSSSVNSKMKNLPELRNSVQTILKPLLAQAFKELKERNDKNPMEFLGLYLLQIAKTIDRQVLAMLPNDFNLSALSSEPGLNSTLDSSAPQHYAANIRFQPPHPIDHQSGFHSFQLNFNNHHDLHPFDGQQHQQDPSFLLANSLSPSSSSYKT